MNNTPQFTREDLIRIIERMEANPDDRLGILADAGITALGAAGAAATAAVLGTTTVSIPLITALTGFALVGAAPVALIAGAAVAGGAVVYGVSRLIKDAGFHEGKRKQLLSQYQEQLREVQRKERQQSLTAQDKIRFYTFLKEPLAQSLIIPEDAYHLIKSVENGQVPLTEAYELVGAVLQEMGQS